MRGSSILFWMMKIFLCSLFLSLGACQMKSKVERYYDVELGANKGDVLERLGSPNSTRRSNGMDHWYYTLRPHKKASRRVLIFDQGTLSYKGPIIPPPLSAEEEDALKEEEDPWPAKEYKRNLTDQQLRDLIRKDMPKSSKKKATPKFEAL